MYFLLDISDITNTSLRVRGNAYGSFVAASYAAFISCSVVSSHADDYEAKSRQIYFKHYILRLILK